MNGPNPPVGYLGLGFTGRAANAMFQASAAIGLARRFGTEPILGPADWPYREWFSLRDEWFPDPTPAVTPPERFARNLSPRARMYLQDRTLWSNAEAEVLAAFSPSPAGLALVDEAWEKIAGLPRPLVSCHVRRGDTITRNPAETLQPLPARYFRDAADLLQPGSVIVFSDDAAWCREALPSEWHVVDGVPGPEDIDADYLTRPRLDHVDLQLQARIGATEGGGMILSNSSFGVWAGYLSRNTDRVCVPSRWFGAKLRPAFHPRHFLLPSWTTVQVAE